MSKKSTIKLFVYNGETNKISSLDVMEIIECIEIMGPSPLVIGDDLSEVENLADYWQIKNDLPKEEPEKDSDPQLKFDV